MECHKCEHQAAVEAGKFRGVAFEETPCGRCNLLECSMGTLAYDEGRATKKLCVEDLPFPEEVETEEEKMPVSVMTTALSMLMAMESRTRDALCQRYLGARYREIAAAQGVTMAAVELRHKRALKKWPELQALFPVKVAKQAQRKPHGRCGRQMRRNLGRTTEGTEETERFMSAE